DDDELQWVRQECASKGEIFLLFRVQHRGKISNGHSNRLGLHLNEFLSQTQGTADDMVDARRRRYVRFGIVVPSLVRRPPDRHGMTAVLRDDDKTRTDSARA